MSLGKVSRDGTRALLLLVGINALAAYGLWYDDLLGATVGSLIVDVRNSGRNSVERGEFTQNYYGEILESERAEEGQEHMMRELNIGRNRSRDPATFIANSSAARIPGTFLPWEFIPDAKTTFHELPLEINQWGMRDRRDYTKEKPDGTFRIAMVGGSTVMGTGVLEEQCFANLIEVKLNQELAGHYYDHYEVLNFSMGGYHLLERLYLIEEKVGEFDPDLILVSGTDKDLTIQPERLARKLKKRQPIHFPFLRQLIREAGVDPRADTKERMERKLHPFMEELLVRTVRELSNYSKEKNVEMAIFLMRRVGGKKLNADLVRTLEVMGREDLTVLPVFEAYEGIEPMELWIGPYTDPDLADPHPNIEGHRRIADNLYELLLADPTIGQMLRAK